MKEAKTLSQKSRELDELLLWFDGDEFNIDQALEKYKQAQELANEIEEELTKIKNEVTVIKKRFDVDK